jgi:membrane associated rhomboid family serine protease
MRYERERIFNLPPVVLWTVALLFAIEGICQLVSPESYLEILERFAFVPGRFTFAFDPDRVALHFGELSPESDFGAEAARFFLGNGKPQWWTVLTYAFLHGGWLHVSVNAIWFAAFGSAVARRFGAPRFLLFCAVAAIAGALAHYLTHMADLEPVVGASAAVSGVMAAAARFVFQPGAPLGESLGFAAVTVSESMSNPASEDVVYRLPALPLRRILSNRSALSFLLFWFLANLLFGAVPATAGVENAAVAWQAHIGGFLVGLLAFRWFDPPAPPYSVPPRPWHPMPWD